MVRKYTHIELTKMANEFFDKEKNIENLAKVNRLKYSMTAKTKLPWKEIQGRIKSLAATGACDETIRP